ncbi:MAG: Fic family protein, partial [Halobacteriovoraceae bacterium]|nr:Fic family protein [Halobacteriovoraceae bacterium]
MDIRNLNKIVLKEPFFKKAQTPDGGLTQKKIIPGEYKKQPNHVKTTTGKIFTFAEPLDVPVEMNDLMNWFNKGMNKPIPSIATFLAELHHRFIMIHPFDDGNGRIARLWVNYTLLFLGYPPLVIKSEDKENYFIALNKADTGDMDSFAIYLGELLILWLKTGIKAAKGEDIEELSDIDKEVDIFVQEQNNKGLNKTVLFSKKAMLKLCDNFLKSFLVNLDKRFSAFNNLFEEMSISLGITSQPDVPIDENVTIAGLYPYIRDAIIKNINSRKINFSLVEVDFEITYKNYKGKTKELKLNPFDMSIRFFLICGKSDYTMKMNIYRENRTVLEKEIDSKTYNHIWTDANVKKLVADIKKDFFSLIKKER